MHTMIRSRIVQLVGTILFLAQLGPAANQTLASEETSNVAETVDQTSRPVAQSRLEKHRQMREEKKQHVEPPKQQFWEKYLYSFDQKGNNSFEDLNFWGFHP